MSLKANSDFSTRAAIKDVLNRMNHTARKAGLGEILENLKAQAVGKYDFAVQGGALGAINLLASDGSVFKLPLNAIVTRAFIDVVTAPTSLGLATIETTIQTAGDIKAATAIASFTGRLGGIPDNTAANMIKLTAERTLLVTIGTAALTAGKFNVYLEYVISE